MGRVIKSLVGYASRLALAAAIGATALHVLDPDAVIPTPRTAAMAAPAAAAD